MHTRDTDAEEVEQEQHVLEDIVEVEEDEDINDQNQHHNNGEICMKGDIHNSWANVISDNAKESERTNDIDQENSDNEREQEESAIEKSKREFYARVAAERAARIEHRRTRKPRTRGVLFKREADGTIVNADLSEEEITKRAERQMKKLNNMKRKKGHQHSRTETRKERYKMDPATDDNNQKDDSGAIRDAKSTKGFIPSPGPTKSAWIAGPPPSMKAATNNNLLAKDGQVLKQDATNGDMNTNAKNKKQLNNSSSKIDEVLHTSLLDIGGNDGTSWSSNSSKPKVAMGPIIMSPWSAFSERGADFESFRSKTPDNNNHNSEDWGMDFALPHGLLSNAADSEEEEAVTTDKSSQKKDIASQPSTRKSNYKGKGPKKYNNNPGMKSNRSNYTKRNQNGEKLNKKHRNQNKEKKPVIAEKLD